MQNHQLKQAQKFQPERRAEVTTSSDNSNKRRTKVTMSKMRMPILGILCCLGAQLMQVINASPSRSSISEFTLDELTNADQSYQPISFGPHQAAGNRLLTSPAFIADGDGLPHYPMGNRIRMIGERKSCHPTKPFLCPSDDPQGGECIPIQYLCDGSSDCPATASLPGGYDEDPLLCTAAKRPPVEDTANFLRTLMNNHGPQYIEKLFGEKISQALMPTGGPERVAIALSVSKTIEDFGKSLHLKRNEIDHLRNVLVAVQTTDGPMLEKLGIVKTTELFDMKFFLEKLRNTGFLD